MKTKKFQVKLGVHEQKCMIHSAWFSHGFQGGWKRVWKKWGWGWGLSEIVKIPNSVAKLYFFFDLKRKTSQRLISYTQIYVQGNLHTVSWEYVWNEDI